MSDSNWLRLYFAYIPNLTLFMRKALDEDVHSMFTSNENLDLYGCCWDKTYLCIQEMLKKSVKSCHQNFVKSVRIWRYSSPHFSAFGLNTEKYSVYLRIQSEWEKMRTRITPNRDTFYAVQNSIKYKSRKCYILSWMKMTILFVLVILTVVRNISSQNLN